jgi:hypothetical protein
MTTLHGNSRFVLRLWPALLLLVAGGGCAHFDWYQFDRTALHYVPPYSVCKPRRKLPYCADPVFFGYHGTCWEQWPEGWEECPSHEVLYIDEQGNPIRMQPHEALPPVQSDVPKESSPPQPSVIPRAPANPPTPDGSTPDGSTPGSTPETGTPDNGAPNSPDTPPPAPRVPEQSSSRNNGYGSAISPAPFRDTAPYTRSGTPTSVRRNATRPPADDSSDGPSDPEPPLPFDLEFGHSHSAVYLKEADATEARSRAKAGRGMDAALEDASVRTVGSLRPVGGSVQLPGRGVSTTISDAPEAPVPPDLGRVVGDDRAR